MKKLIVLFLSVLLTACSTQSSPEPFYRAFQSLLEQPYTHFEGSIKMTSFSMDIEGTMASNPFELEMILREDPILAFYIKNGKTYLNDDGVKTSSVASNIGLNVKKATDLNPFTQLSPSQRSSLFNSVSASGDEYTLEINPNALEQMVDQYGAISLSKGVIKATIVNEAIKKLEVQASGTLNYGITLPFNILAKFSFEKTDSITLPKDLDSYTAE